MQEEELNWDEVLTEARRKLSPVCTVCPACNGVVCAGKMPGMGGLGTGASFKNNYNALAEYRLNMRTLHDVATPDLSVSLFGQRLALPVLGAAVAGGKMNMNDAISEEDLAQAFVAGAKAAGTWAMTGDGPLPLFMESGLAAIKREGGHGIPIIKPRPLPDILSRAERAVEAGAVAVGIDVDGAALVPMTRAGQPVGPKPPAEIKELARLIPLPLILKGIMTADEAEIAAEAGAAGIVVSNHGGRSLDHLAGTAEVLPEIAAAVKGKIAILVDGGVRTGVDVLKMLALGADAVLVGRPVAIAAIGAGAEGVETFFRRIGDELRTAMLLTGCPSPADAGPRLVRKGS
jgi:isopentenyl diphosphate isomerase/L-lactate dehydrogenase-like FMN-dependent dehydrogenase